MNPVVVPLTDVNSESAFVSQWLVPDRSFVKKGQILCNVETSKSVIEIAADCDGFVLIHAAINTAFTIDKPVAFIFASADEVAAAATKARSETPVSPDNTGAVRASKKARDAAQRLGVDLSSLGLNRLITERDVMAAAAHKNISAPDFDLLKLPAVPKGNLRILLIGGGLGATQVLNILAQYTDKNAVCILDDTPEKWGTELKGIPIVGPTNLLAKVAKSGAVDAMAITISTSVPARKRYREAAVAAGLPLVNIIDTSAVLGRDLIIGTGNIICALCHFGNATVIGDNNFFSAYNSIDHHNRIGSDISTGPGCMTSALVVIGNRVRLGTGIFIEPYLELGEGVQVASGSILTTSVPAGHVVKTKIVTTTIVPIRT